MRQVPSTRRILPEVENLIEGAWKEVLAQPGVKLFDGPMCRMESWHGRPDLLEIALSETSYKPFLGTNLAHPEFVETYGREVMADPVGVSPALETVDGFLMLGKRNGTVAYYPNRTHPFAGALEPRDGGDLFAAVLRELGEELSLRAEDVAEIRCTGIAEDLALRQPELLFRVKTSLTRAQVEAQVHQEEHRDSVAVKAEAGSVERLLGDPALTPVGMASSLLWGRVKFGEGWFEKVSKVAVGRVG